MLKPAARLGDMSTGHDGYPPRPAVQASDNVFINNKGAVRLGDKWAVHCRRSCHDGVSYTGSNVVFINNRAAVRIGDKISCGDTVAQGSTNVYIG